MSFRPLHDRVLVRRVKEEEKSKGGIIIPDTVKEKPQEGKIVAVGSGARGEDGKVTPLDVKAGDRILFGKWSGTEVTIDGEELIIMKESDILGIVEKPAAAIVRHIGARHVVVTDVNPYRLAMAAAHGATRVVDVAHQQLGPVMIELGMTEGFDVGLEMSGAESAFNQMLDSMNHGGRIAVLGIPAGPMTLDINDVIFKGLEIQGIYGRRIFETWYKMAAMLQSGLDVSGIVTHRLPADQFHEAFDIVGRGECGKVILDWADA